MYGIVSNCCFQIQIPAPIYWYKMLAIVYKTEKKPHNLCSFSNRILSPKAFMSSMELSYRGQVTLIDHPVERGGKGKIKRGKR